MLGCVGRGGNAQAIRDEILNIMHRNHIGEKRGTWMEVSTLTHSAAQCSAFGRHTAAVLCLPCLQKGIHMGSYSSSCLLTYVCTGCMRNLLVCNRVCIGMQTTSTQQSQAVHFTVGAAMMDACHAVLSELQDWHQKLHNNTTPDDIVICEAFIAFLDGNGDNGAYWRHLTDNGITRERLEGFDRAIKVFLLAHVAQPFVVRGPCSSFAAVSGQNGRVIKAHSLQSTLCSAS